MSLGRFYSENFKGTDHTEYVCIDCVIILKMYLKLCFILCTKLIWLGIGVTEYIYQINLFLKNWFSNFWPSELIPGLLKKDSFPLSLLVHTKYGMRAHTVFFCLTLSGTTAVFINFLSFGKFITRILHINFKYFSSTFFV